MRALVVLIAIMVSGSGVAAQDATRVRARVDYIASRNLYLSAGMQQGLFEGDTAAAFREGARETLGRLLIVNSTRTRAVALLLNDSLLVAAGDVLELIPPPAALERARALEAARADSARPNPVAASAPPMARNAPVDAGVFAHGRISLDLDAFMTQSRFGVGSEAIDRRTFTTPAARVRATVGGLPGGLQLNTNLRAQYFGGGVRNGEEFEARIYQASVARDSSLFRFQLGRFYNPYESHSGYWDGLLLRLGGDRIGGGVALGYNPPLREPGFSSAYPKRTAFIDLHHRNQRLRYDANASVHDQTSEFFADKRNLIGVTQQLGLRGVYFSQRVQFGKTESDRWSLWQLQTSLSVNVMGPVQATARYSAERFGLFEEKPSESPKRVRWSAGLNLSAHGLFASLEAGTARSGTGPAGATVQGTVMVPRTLLGIGLGLTGSHWREAGVSSTFISPSIDRSFGSVRVHAAAHYNRSVFSLTTFEQQAAELSATIPLPGRAELMISANRSHHQQSTSTRILTSIWQSF